MSDHQHTPGPWTVKLTEAEANARVMAAATDLLVALGKCITVLTFELEEAQRREDVTAGRQIADALRSAHAAVAKARGA